MFTYFGTQTPDYPPQRSNSSSNQTLILLEDQRTFTIPDGLPYAEYTVTLQPFNVKTDNRAPPYSMTVRTIAIGKQMKRIIFRCQFLFFLNRADSGS